MLLISFTLLLTIFVTDNCYSVIEKITLFTEIPYRIYLNIFFSLDFLGYYLLCYENTNVTSNKTYILNQKFWISFFVAGTVILWYFLKSFFVSGKTWFAPLKDSLCYWKDAMCFVTVRKWPYCYTYSLQTEFVKMYITLGTLIVQQLCPCSGTLWILNLV